jgi:ABC-2 type transport system ATP-binding protein
MSSIECEGLCRDFTVRRRAGRLRRQRVDVRAVDQMSFVVQDGESVGYIGANGAGKSTTIKMITGILAPTEGRVRTCGLQPQQQRRELAHQVGVVFGQRTQLWWDLPLAESFDLLAAIHRIAAVPARQRIAELVDQLELGSFLATPVRQLSLGQRMRGEVAAALVHRPRLLVLDEPTVGLDVLSKERLRVFLREEQEQHGRTLLLTTHDLSDIERLCQRVLVVDHGRLAYAGTLPGLVDRVGAKRVLTVDLVAPAPPLDGIPGTTLISVEGGADQAGIRQRLAFRPDRTTAAAVLAAVSARAEVRDLTIDEPDIEEVVRELYAGSDR